MPRLHFWYNVNVFSEEPKYLPYAFTENGIAMLSSVLRSETAIEVNIRIMRAFTAMRRFVSDHAGLVQRVGAIELKQLETDKRIDTVFAFRSEPSRA